MCPSSESRSFDSNPQYRRQRRCPRPCRSRVLLRSVPSMVGAIRRPHEEFNAMAGNGRLCSNPIRHLMQRMEYLGNPRLRHTTVMPFRGHGDRRTRSRRHQPAIHMLSRSTSSLDDIRSFDQLLDHRLRVDLRLSIHIDAQPAGHHSTASTHSRPSLLV